MNDDLLTPKTQPAPIESSATSAPNDTEEQDTVSDRVFDFTDGDIKPVSDLDGPVTHKVNLEIAEALRNPSATINSMKTGAPVVTPQPVAAPSPVKPPINKLEEVPPVVAPIASKPIPHPPIDPAMQAPAVKVYSQIPHTPTQTTAPSTPVQAPQPTPNIPKPANKFVTEASTTPKLPVEPALPSTQKSPENPASAAALQEILKKVHTQTQAKPPTIKENLLDRNIGSLDATPFAAPTNSVPSQSVSTPVTPNKASAPIPLKEIPKPVNKTRPDPYNAPSKVIGARPSDYTATPIAQSKQPSLQDAVSSVLPGDKPEISKPFQSQSGPFKPIRTYEGDVAEVMSHRRPSTTSIAIAEAQRAEGEERLSNNDAPTNGNSNLTLKIVMVLLIILLLGGGTFAGYYLYTKSPLATSISKTPVQQAGRPGIIRADSYAVIPIDNQLSSVLLSRIRSEAAKDQPVGTIKEIILARKAASSNTATFTQISAPDAISGLDISMPDILSRTITSDWMLGIYSGPASQKGAFVIVTTNFFQNAFAGMLQWEATIADDLKRFIYPQTSSGVVNARGTSTNSTSTPTLDIDSLLPSIVPASTSVIMLASSTKQTSTTTASSTNIETVQPLKSYFALRGAFEDRILKNKDVRAFRTDDGAILFLYSFIDNSHLAIASDEATLIEVLTRLEKQALIR